MQKFLTGLIFVLNILPTLSSRAVADELSPNQVKRLDAFKKVVAKHEFCEFAVASFPKGKFAKIEHFQPNTVTCIGSLKLGAGTLKERWGCAAFHIDLQTGQIRTVAGDYYPGYFPMAEGKPCESSFEEVVSKKANPTVGGTVSDLLLYGSAVATRTAAETYTQVIVFAKKSQLQSLTGSKSVYEEWFEKAGKKPEQSSKEKK